METTENANMSAKLEAAKLRVSLFAEISQLCTITNYFHTMFDVLAINAPLVKCNESSDIIPFYIGMVHQIREQNMQEAAILYINTVIRRDTSMKYFVGLDRLVRDLSPEPILQVSLISEACTIPTDVDKH